MKAPRPPTKAASMGQAEPATSEANRAMAMGMDGRAAPSGPAVLTPEPRRMDTRATAATRAMVGAVIFSRAVPQAWRIFSPFILCRPMVMMDTRMKGMVPGRLSRAILEVTPS